MLTNTAGLPQAIVDAIANDPYSAGRPEGVDRSHYATCTQLVAPTQQVVLKERHKDEITEDAADRIWSLIGQSVHTILERAAATPYERLVRMTRELRSMLPAEPKVGNLIGKAGNAILEARELLQPSEKILTERRLYAKFGAWTVGGAFDHLDVRDGVLTDYKVTATYSVKDGTAKIEWLAQNNVNAELCEVNGYPVKKAQIIAFLRDWHQSEAARDPSYPQTQVMVIETPLWDRSARVAWIESRLAAIDEARAHGDELLPECSADERWERGSKFVVVKDGNKRATPGSGRQTLEEAEEFAEALRRTKKGAFRVEFRRAESKRCEGGYCSAFPFCFQAKRLGVGAESAEESSDA